MRLAKIKKQVLIWEHAAEVDSLRPSDAYMRW